MIKQILEFFKASFVLLQIANRLNLGPGLKDLAEKTV
jgi:hypothetical protein